MKIAENIAKSMKKIRRAHMAVAAMWRESSPAVTGLLGEASWDASELLIGVYSTFAIEFSSSGARSDCNYKEIQCITLLFELRYQNSYR